MVLLIESLSLSRHEVDELPQPPAAFSAVERVVTISFPKGYTCWAAPVKKSGIEQALFTGRFPGLKAISRRSCGPGAERRLRSSSTLQSTAMATAMAAEATRAVAKATRENNSNHLYSGNETWVTKRRTTVRTNTYATDSSDAYVHGMLKCRCDSPS